MSFYSGVSNAENRYPDSKRLKTNIQNATFTSSKKVYKYTDSIRNCSLKEISPCESLQLGVAGSAPTNAIPTRQIIKFKIQPNGFFKLNKMWIYLEGNFGSGEDFIPYGYFVNAGDCVQIPWWICQQFEHVKIKVAGINVTSQNVENRFSISDSFITRIPKEDEVFVDRLGYPFQKLIQEQCFNPAFYSRVSDYKTRKFVQLFIDNGAYQRDFTKFSIPLYLFSNFFAQDLWMPPSVEIEIELTMNTGEGLGWFVIAGPGIEIIDPLGSFYFPIGMLNAGAIKLRWEEYKFSSILERDFMQTWQNEPLLVHFHQSRLLSDPQLAHPGSLTTNFSTRLEIDKFTNAGILMIWVCNQIRDSTNFQRTLFTVFTSTPNTPIYAESIPEPTDRLCLYPFKLSNLRIYNENSNLDIINFDSVVKNPEIIHEYLSRMNKNLFKNADNENEVDFFDIYGRRAAPLFINLTNQQYYNSTFGGIPSQANLKIDFTITDIIGNPLNNAQVIEFHLIEPVTFSITNSKQASLFQSPTTTDSLNNSITIVRPWQE